MPLSQPEVDRILHTATVEAKPRARAEFMLGEQVKVTSGPLSDFDGEIVEVNPDAGRLKVSVSIFERQVPVELSSTRSRRSSNDRGRDRGWWELALRERLHHQGGPTWPRRS